MYKYEYEIFLSNMSFHYKNTYYLKKARENVLSNAMGLPISHSLPVYPDIQLQTYPLIRSVQRPCKQGELEHSSIS